MAAVLKDVAGVRRVKVSDWYEVRTVLHGVAERVSEHMQTMTYDDFKRSDTALEAVKALANMYREVGDELMSLASEMRWIGEVQPTSAQDLLVVAQSDKMEVVWAFMKLGEECEDYYVNRMRRFLRDAESQFGVFYDLVGDLYDLIQKLADIGGVMNFHAGYYTTVRA